MYWLYFVIIQHNNNLHRIYIVLGIISNLESFKIKEDIGNANTTQCKYYTILWKGAEGFGMCTGTWCPKTNLLRDTDGCVHSLLTEYKVTGLCTHPESPKSNCYSFLYFFSHHTLFTLYWGKSRHISIEHHEWLTRLHNSINPSPLLQLTWF